MRHLNKALAVVSLTILASMGTVQPAPAADNDGKTLRAYLAIPFGGKQARQDDVQIGLQMLQGIKHTDSGPVDKFSDLALFDISFNGHGLERTDVMGIDMMTAYNLMNESPKLGQATTGPTNVFALAVIVGGTAAGIMCATGTICNHGTPVAPAAKPVCPAFAAFGNDPIVANISCVR